MMHPSLYASSESDAIASIHLVAYYFSIPMSKITEAKKEHVYSTRMKKSKHSHLVYSCKHAGARECLTYTLWYVMTLFTITNINTANIYMF